MTNLPASEIRALHETLTHPHGAGSGCQCTTDIEITPHESELAPHEPEATLVTHHNDYHTHHGRPAKTPMQPVDIDQITTTWIPRFELLADLTWLKLLSYMHIYPGSCAQNLAKAAGITQTAASQALRVLRDEDWVSAQRAGRLMRYALKDTATHQMLHFTGHTHVQRVVVSRRGCLVA